MRQLNKVAVALIVWAAIWLLQASQGSILAAEPEKMLVDQLKSILDDGQDVVVVDVRSAGSYAKGHIPGAISIPSGEIRERHEELPKSKTIIFY